MTISIHRDVIVGPNGTIEIPVPELQPGQHVSITIQSDQSPSGASLQESATHIIDLVKDQPGGRLFKTADEADAYLREERDSWDR